MIGDLTVTGTLGAGNSALGNTTITGNSTVTGNSSVGGNTSLGNSLNVAGATTLNSMLDVAGDTTLADTGMTGTLYVAGATTLDDTLEVTGDATLANTDVTGTLNVAGATTLNSTLDVDTSGALSGGGSLSMDDSSISMGVDSDNTSSNGSSAFTLTETQASLTVTNSTGNTHGLVVGETATTLSGGTYSTTLTLDDNGATFGDEDSIPVTVTGVADGKRKYDAVNFGQFEELENTAFAGIASVSAIASIPDPSNGKRFSIGMGYGYFEGVSAGALGVKADVTQNLRVTLAGGLARGISSVNAGVGFSW